MGREYKHIPFQIHSFNISGLPVPGSKVHVMISELTLSALGRTHALQNHKLLATDVKQTTPCKRALLYCQYPSCPGVQFFLPPTLLGKLETATAFWRSSLICCFSSLSVRILFFLVLL